MRSSAIARRYAKALILIGREDGQAETYRSELETIVGLLNREQMLEQAVSNPLYEAASRRNVLKAVSEKLELSRVMKSFVLLIFDKGRINYLRDVSAYYTVLADELKGIVRADLTTATELAEETLEQIRASLSKLTGKDVSLETKLDKSLIGGIVTRIGDLVLDGSIKTQLQNMRESLKRGERV
ncbi:MAG: ATP synthase F1 subunit delta [Desulfobacterales bacterium CG23_combo_of_CG06-09_8_20_14_all_51_8]|nr:MAG: ATP synthase F1 subunit delta [Desulfobacterales bacterium CG23_combo_of_CG06-09_8_20_14_all_51_8]